MVDAKGLHEIRRRLDKFMEDKLIEGYEIQRRFWFRRFLSLRDPWALRVFWGNVTECSFSYNRPTANTVERYMLLGQANLFSSPVKLGSYNHHNFSQKGELRDWLELGSYMKHQTCQATGQQSHNPHLVISIHLRLKYIKELRREMVNCNIKLYSYMFYSVFLFLILLFQFLNKSLL